MQGPCQWMQATEGALPLRAFTQDLPPLAHMLLPGTEGTKNDFFILLELNKHPHGPQKENAASGRGTNQGHCDVARGGNKQS